MSKWREKFNFHPGRYAISRDKMILCAYSREQRTTVSCLREWNKIYAATLTENEFVNMAKSLGYGRGK